MTGGSRTQAQPREMQFLQETHPIFRSLTLRRRYQTTTRETGKHSKDAQTKKSERGKTIPRSYRLLQKVCTQVR